MRAQRCKPLHITAGVCYGVRLVQQSHLTWWTGWVKGSDPQFWKDQYTAPVVSDKFAFCYQRDSESFCGQTLHVPLLSRLHLTIMSNFFDHWRPHKLLVYMSELPCAMPSAAQTPACLSGWCWDFTTATGRCHRLHKHACHPSMQEERHFRCFRRDNLLFFIYSMHGAPITILTAKILPAWKCYSSILAFTLWFL